jgi:hypothetical protein
MSVTVMEGLETRERDLQAFLTWIPIALLFSMFIVTLSEIPCCKGVRREMTVPVYSWDWDLKNGLGFNSQVGSPSPGPEGHLTTLLLRHGSRKWWVFSLIYFLCF